MYPGFVALPCRRRHQYIHSYTTSATHHSSTSADNTASKAMPCYFETHKLRCQNSFSSEVFPSRDLTNQEMVLQGDCNLNTLCLKGEENVDNIRACWWSKSTEPREILMLVSFVAQGCCGVGRPASFERAGVIAVQPRVLRCLLLLWLKLKGCKQEIC